MTVDGLWNIGQGKYTKSDDINNKSVDNSDKKSIIELKINMFDKSDPIYLDALKIYSCMALLRLSK